MNLPGIAHRAVSKTVWSLGLSALLFAGAAPAVTLHVSAAQTNTAADEQATAANAPTDVSGRLGLRAAFSVLAANKARIASAGDADSVEIQLGWGTYRLTQPITLTVHPSWRGTPITISGFSEDRTIISGSRVIRRFRPVRDPAVAARLPDAARGHVLVAQLADSGITDAGTFDRHGFDIRPTPAPLELFYCDQPATLARWPNEGFATIASLPAARGGGASS